MEPTPGPRERVLFVHAHPDDETIATGGMLALLSDAGTEVTVLTCTRGELGEVIPESLRHLEGNGPALARHREGELAAALLALGVHSHHYLGAPDARAAGLPPRDYLDSGMRWGADGMPEPVEDIDALALCSAPFDEVVADIAAAAGATGADALVSYDANGGYGHPDHVLAHRATRAAAERLGLAFHEIVEHESELTPGDVERFDVTSVLGRKVAALRAHATQVTVIERPGEPIAFALSNGIERPVATVEGLRLDTLALPPETGDPEPETASSRIASAGVSFVIGALIGVLLTINHQHRISPFGLDVPLGLIAAILVLAALLVGMRLVFASRLVALCTALGVVAVTALLSQEGPGGSVLVPANFAGVVWAYAPIVIGLIVVGWPKVRAIREGRMEPQPTQEGSPL